MSQSLALGLAQMRISANLQENLQQSVRLLGQARAAGCELLVYPELQLTPYFPQYPGRRDLAHACEQGGRELGVLRGACAAYQIAAVPNVYLREGARRYDASVAISAGGAVLGVGKRVHVAQLPRFYEQDYDAPSTEGFLVAELAGIRVGTIVSSDRHFAESFCACAQQGAQVVVIPTAITAAERSGASVAALRAVACENKLFIALVNRVGDEDALRFCGGSMVIDPHGTVLMQADARPGLHMVRLELPAPGEALSCLRRTPQRRWRRAGQALGVTGSMGASKGP